MSIQYIREYYGLTVKIGDKVKYTGDGKPRIGRVTSAEGAHIRVAFDDTRMRHRLHPTWMIEYLK